MRYKIPRNIKLGLSFLGLQLKGWLLFVPSLIIIGLITYLIFIVNYKLAVMFAMVGVGVAYFAFQTDEKTGQMNVSWVFEYLRWERENKIIEPAWDISFNRFQSLKMKVNYKNIEQSQGDE